MSKQTELAQVADTITVDSGNVGIGTSSPAYALDVQDDNATRHLRVFRNASGTSAIMVQNADTGSGSNDGLQLSVLNGGDAQIANLENTNLRFLTNSAEAMRIDSAGRVTTPYQPAAFVAKDNGGGFTTFSGIMVFNDVKLNRGNCYNSSTGIFTCPAAGVYRVHAEALTGVVTASCHVRVYKNGVSVVASGAHSNYQGSTYYTIGTEALVQCAVNDQLSVVMTSSGNALYQNADYTKATFMMVG